MYIPEWNSNIFYIIKTGDTAINFILKETIRKRIKARLYVDGEEVLETAFFNIDRLLKNYGKKNDEEVKSDAKVTGKKNSLYEKY